MSSNTNTIEAIPEQEARAADEGAQATAPAEAGTTGASVTSRINTPSIGVLIQMGGGVCGPEPAPPPRHPLGAPPGGALLRAQ
jgi:hypothetical protein